MLLSAYEYMSNLFSHKWQAGINIEFVFLQAKKKASKCPSRNICLLSYLKRALIRPHVSSLMLDAKTTRSRR
jgi:hypothetical protein